MFGVLEGVWVIQWVLGDSGNVLVWLYFVEFLVWGGWVKDCVDVFCKWLGVGKLGDVKQYWLILEEVVGCLCEVCVWISLVYLYYYDFIWIKCWCLVVDFFQVGGYVIEVVNGVQLVEQVGILLILVCEFGLMVIVGSDFYVLGDWFELGMYCVVLEDFLVMWLCFVRYFCDIECYFEVKGVE